MQASVEKRMDACVGKFLSDISGLRTGRANAGLLDGVLVEAYGSKSPLPQLASVNVADSRLIVVNVWDRTLAGAVERGIRQSSLGLNPIVEGQNIRVPLPAPNEERRMEMVKAARQYAERAKVSVRQVRQDSMQELKAAKKRGDINEASQNRQEKEIQTATDSMIDQITAALVAKEIEILTV